MFQLLWVMWLCQMERQLRLVNQIYFIDAFGKELRVERSKGKTKLRGQKTGKAFLHLP